MFTKQVIFNADDFGRSPAINTAVIQAHRQGVLTSASMMVAGEAGKEAVELARATPTLAVGLHLVVGNGQAVLPYKEIPHLVDVRGRFREDPLHCGLLYWFSRKAQSELAQELRAQFQRFAATGLPLSHVDGHLHLHIHPTVFNLVLPLAEEYRVHGLRLPLDELGPALRYNHKQVVTKAAWAIALGLVCRWCQRRLRESHLLVPQQVYGVMQSGQMHKAYVVKMLHRLRKPTTELFFHPSTSSQREALGPNPGDLETLLSPAVRQAIEERGLRLATYTTLEEVR
jgi:hopanoid biosynthesis associated protein HpnK